MVPSIYSHTKSDETALYFDIKICSDKIFTILIRKHVSMQVNGYRSIDTHQWYKYMDIKQVEWLSGSTRKSPIHCHTHIWEGTTEITPHRNNGYTFQGFCLQNIPDGGIGYSTGAYTYFLMPSIYFGRKTFLLLMQTNAGAELEIFS